MKKLFSLLSSTILAAGCASTSHHSEGRVPAQAREQAMLVVVCKSGSGTDLEFFGGPRLSMRMDEHDGQKEREYSISPADVDIIAFFRERSTKLLSGNFTDENGVSYPLTISHEEGVPTVRRSSSGYGFNISCTLPDGSPFAKPLPLSPLPKLNFPVCQRTRTVREELERRLQTSCDSIDMRKLMTVKRLDLSNRDIMALMDGDFEGIGYIEKGRSNPILEISSINLSHNFLETIPEGLFGYRGRDGKGLQSAYVKQFDLSHNRLRDQPDFLKSGKFIYPIDEDQNQDTDKFWDFSHNQLTTLKLFFQLCGQSRFSHNQISTLPTEIRMTGACKRDRVQSIDLSDNLISDATLEGVSKIEVSDNSNKAFLLHNNPLTKFDLGKIRHAAGKIWPTIEYLSLGGMGAVKFDLSSLKKPFIKPDYNPKIGQLKVSNCTGTPGIDFPVLTRLIFSDCEVFLPNGFGIKNELGNVRLENVLVKDVNVTRLLDGLHFESSDPLYRGQDKWWLGVLELTGRTRISARELELIRKEYALREKNFYFAWDCGKPNQWWSDPFDSRGCKFLRVGPDIEETKH